MTSKHECYVYIMLPGTTEFITAARFRVSQTDDQQSMGEFIYGKNYLARQDAVALDPVELRLMQARYQTIKMHGFFGAIRDAMPDFWGRRVIERNIRKTGIAEFDYLLQGPDDRAGALGFGLNVVPPAPQKQFNRTLNLAILQEMADAILSDAPIKKNVRDQQQVAALLLQGTSMGGARPKTVIEDAHCLWIAKFSTPTDRWNQPRVEHALLKLAKKCGLQVADSKIVSIANKEVLLVKRFDREYSQQGYLRHRMISALTLLQSDDDPSLYSNWSYLLLADEIRRVSACPVDDLCELFGRICFNALVSNADDHPRNHAILAKTTQWRLSPAYDLTPTLSFSQERFLAMQCGNQGRLASKKNILSAHERFLLSKQEAELLVENMINIIKKEWVNCLRRAGVTEKDITLVATAFLAEGFFYP